MERPPLLTVNDYTPDHRVSARLEDWLSDSALAGFRPTINGRSWSEKLSNRAGNIPDTSATASDYHDIVCAWPFEAIVLTPLLEAILCCSDYRHEMIVGDLNTQSLMDIWNGPVLTEVRKKMLDSQRLNIPLCTKCDAEWFSLPTHCRQEVNATAPY